MFVRPKTTEKIRWIDDAGKNPEPVQVASISQKCFGAGGWTAKEVRQFMNRTDHIPKVILRNNKVVGYVFYVLHQRVVEIRQLAVDPEYRRQGLGKQLVQHLLQALPSLRRRVVAIEVPEHHLEAQVFLRDLGFRWFRTLRKGTTTEAYLMKFIQGR